ncbi:hypothetical protein BS47DRAFT_1335116 [Hydnum rufescens UP504]|uniref:Cytochrome P450 n=1 Tax=Hydnum rufescens UP504 TaxID=1448309 RepID=A0A9P6BB16_9AGAM|nr:hypothetical protein BS47DRAFT_1335116 [Hydnum rufescens UP504]
MAVPLQAFVAFCLVLFSWLFHEFVVKAIRSPLRDLPGPRSKGLFSGHMPYAMDPHWSPAAHDQWSKRFGLNMCIKGLNWFDNRLLTLDPRAVTYVLNQTTVYEKPPVSRRLLASLIGAGLLASEGSHHRRQRKVMNPAFSPANLRELTPVFFGKAYELREKWLSLMTDKSKGEHFDVTHWLGRATFDVIGIAGFGYQFNAIQEENEEVYMAYKTMFERTVNKGQDLMDVTYLYFPILATLFPNEHVRIKRRSQAIIYKAGKALVEKKKREFREGNTKSRDLLSLLVRSNMAADVDPSQRISDLDISNQINTFLFAGSDTTSLGLSWCLLFLAQKPEIQARLRTELDSLARQYEHSDDDGYATAEFFALIDKLPLLDNICRETLRFVPPVHSSIRVALKDDVIPISSQMRFEGKDAEAKLAHMKKSFPAGDGIRIAKGEFIHIAVEGFNLSKDVWGEDAHEFNPDRWDNLPDAARSAPGLYSNIMTFGAGPRSCIGMRFSMIEMKTFLFVFIRTFSFSDPPNVMRVNVILTRPFVKEAYNKGSQLPLLITPLHGPLSDS